MWADKTMDVKPPAEVTCGYSRSRQKTLESQDCRSLCNQCQRQCTERQIPDGVWGRACCLQTPTSELCRLETAYMTHMVSIFNLGDNYFSQKGKIKFREVKRKKKKIWNSDFDTIHEMPLPSSIIQIPPL